MKKIKIQLLLAAIAITLIPLIQAYAEDFDSIDGIDTDKLYEGLKDTDIDEDTLDQISEVNEMLKEREDEMYDSLKEQYGTYKDSANRIGQELCYTTGSTLVTKMSFYDRKLESHASIYGNILKKSRSLSYTFSNNGLDTTTLDKHIHTLQGKIESFHGSFNGLINNLGKDLSDVSCQKSSKEMQELIESTGKNADNLVDERQEIRSFYAKNIRPEMLRLKNALEKRYL